MTREEINKRHYQKNRDKIRIKQKAYKVENKERLKEMERKHCFKREEYYKEYYKTEKGKESKKRRWRRYEEKNKEKIKKYYETNKEKIKARVTKYRKSEKGRMNALNAVHKRRQTTKLTDITTKYLTELKLNTTHCEVCRKKLNGKIHLDHIIPLNVGGLHVKSNIRYIHATCNLMRPKNGSDIIQNRFMFY